MFAVVHNSEGVSNTRLLHLNIKLCYYVLHNFQKICLKIKKNCQKTYFVPKNKPIFVHAHLQFGLNQLHIRIFVGPNKQIVGNSMMLFDISHKKEKFVKIRSENTKKLKEKHKKQQKI